MAAVLLRLTSTKHRHASTGFMSLALGLVGTTSLLHSGLVNTGTLAIATAVLMAAVVGAAKRYTP